MLMVFFKNSKKYLLIKAGNHKKNANIPLFPESLHAVACLSKS